MTAALFEVQMQRFAQHIVFHLTLRAINSRRNKALGGRVSPRGILLRSTMSTVGKHAENALRRWEMGYGDVT